MTSINYKKEEWNNFTATYISTPCKKNIAKCFTAKMKTIRKYALYKPMIF